MIILRRSMLQKYKYSHPGPGQKKGTRLAQACLCAKWLCAGLCAGPVYSCCRKKVLGANPRLTPRTWESPFGGHFKVTVQNRLCAGLCAVYIYIYIYAQTAAGNAIFRGVCAEGMRRIYIYIYIYSIGAFFEINTVRAL